MGSMSCGGTGLTFGPLPLAVMLLSTATAAAAVSSLDLESGSAIGVFRLGDLKSRSSGKRHGLCVILRRYRDRGRSCGSGATEQLRGRFGRFPLGLIDFGGGAEECLGVVHYRFAERWMRMDCLRDVGHFAAHFDGESSFGNQLTCPSAHDPDTQYALGIGIDQHFG